MMNKHHYLHVNEDLEATADLEEQPEVAAPVPEAVVEEQFWLQEIRGMGDTPTSITTTTTSHLEAVSDNWHKREPDSCTYIHNKTPGSTEPLSDGTTSLDLFCGFFADEAWDLLVAETNRYAHDNQSTAPTP